MPRPRFSDRIITPNSIEILANQSYDLYIDLVDSFYPQIMIRQTWTSTASGGSGIDCTLYSGFVVNATPYVIAASQTNSSLSAPGTVEFADNGTAISMVDPTLGSSNQTTRTKQDINAEQTSRFQKLHIVNSDAINTVTVFVAGDW